MHFKILLASAAAALIGNVGAAAIHERAALIATDPFYACNCPNNCDYTAGSSCKYYSGPSDTSDVIDGTCVDNGGLTCVA